MTVVSPALRELLVVYKAMLLSPVSLHSGSLNTSSRPPPTVSPATPTLHSYRTGALSDITTARQVAARAHWDRVKSMSFVFDWGVTE